MQIRSVQRNYNEPCCRTIGSEQIHGTAIRLFTCLLQLGDADRNAIKPLTHGQLRVAAAAGLLRVHPTSSLVKPMHKSNGFFMLPENVPICIKWKMHLAKKILLAHYKSVLFLSN